MTDWINGTKDWISSTVEIGTVVRQEITRLCHRDMVVIKVTPTFVWIATTKESYDGQPFLISYTPVRQNVSLLYRYWVKVRRESGLVVGKSTKGPMDIWTTGAKFFDK